MRLSEFLKAENIYLAELRRRVLAHPAVKALKKPPTLETFRRHLLPEGDRDHRMPCRLLMRAYFDVSRGRVQPNDFYGIPSATTDGHGAGGNSAAGPKRRAAIPISVRIAAARKAAASRARRRSAT